MPKHLVAVCVVLAIMGSIMSVVSSIVSTIATVLPFAASAGAYFVEWDEERLGMLRSRECIHQSIAHSQPQLTKHVIPPLRFAGMQLHLASFLLSCLLCMC